MRLINRGALRDVPTLGLFGIKPGDEIEVTGDDAKSLQTQDFERAAENKASHDAEKEAN